MKIKLFPIITVLTILVSLLGFTTVAQAGAYGVSFTTAITYMNTGTGAATIHLDFYAQNSSTAIPIDLPSLNALAGSSIFVGGISQISSGFSGSAVMSSNMPLAVTIVQVPDSLSGIKARPLTNGLSSGSAFVMIPTIIKNQFDANSVFSVQNASAGPIDVAVKFIEAVTGNTITKNISQLPAGSGQVYDLGQMTDWNAAPNNGTFNGSVQINATGGVVVATSIEYQITGKQAYGFEGTGTDANTFYMPSAFCRYDVVNTWSAYAVQNTNPPGGADAQVTVTYKSLTGTTYTETTQTIPAGQKKSFQGCGSYSPTPPIPSGFIGSATITSTGGKIVAIGKIYNNNMYTAFMGFSDAPSKVALPYVRWASDATWPAGANQRSYIAIQNIGGADLAAGAVTVKYYDINGVQQGTTHSLPAIAMGGKTNSNPTNAGLTSFGYYGTLIGGTAVIEGPVGSKLAVVVRVQGFLSYPNNTNGEDYNGIAFQ